MKKIDKLSGISLKGLIAGGLIAGAVGLGFGEGSYGSPSSSGASGTEQAGEDTGMGGAKEPATPHTQALPPNVAPGWKIRVCSEKTKAQAIDFRAYPAEDKGASKAAKKTSGAEPTGTGTGGEATTQDPAMTAEKQAQASIQTTSWNQGESSLITLPESLAKIEKIKIEAVPAQKDMKSEVCVLYNDHVAKKITFDEKSETTVKMNEAGTCGC